MKSTDFQPCQKRQERDKSLLLETLDSFELQYSMTGISSHAPMLPVAEWIPTPLLQQPVVTGCTISSEITVTTSADLSHPSPRMGSAFHLSLDPRAVHPHHSSNFLSWSLPRLPFLLSALD